MWRIFKRDFFWGGFGGVVILLLRVIIYWPEKIFWQCRYVTTPSYNGTSVFWVALLKKSSAINNICITKLYAYVRKKKDAVCDWYQPVFHTAICSVNATLAPDIVYLSIWIACLCYSLEKCHYISCVQTGCAMNHLCAGRLLSIFLLFSLGIC